MTEQHNGGMLGSVHDITPTLGVKSGEPGTCVKTVWIWRILPHWTADIDLAHGVRRTESGARLAATDAMLETDGFAAMICKLGLEDGELTRLSEPIIGLPAADGAIKWLV